MDIENLIRILEEHKNQLHPYSYEYQRFGHYIKALNFTLGKYRKDNEIYLLLKKRGEIK